MKECKGCGNSIKRGEYCGNCERKLPLIQALIEAGRPLRRLKAIRDERRRAEAARRQ